MAKKSARKVLATLYSVHPAIAYAQTILRNLPEKTGRSLDEWAKLVKKSGVRGGQEQKAWLKQEHKLGGTTASMIVEQAHGTASEDMDPAAYLSKAPQYVEVMYAGPKAALRPIHDALIELGLSFGDDVKICPCQTIVPLYRNHVFAQIKPTTRTRIDLGLALKGVGKKISKRLIDTGGLAKGDRITHRIPINALVDIDDEVRRWVAIAYELDA